MLRSCKYCGRIHDTKAICPKKPKRIRIASYDEAAIFRRTGRWKDLSISIRERDSYLCQLCKRGMTLDGKPYYNGNTLSVHHIIPVAEAPELATERLNLITLCGFHHEEAEAGRISREDLAAIAAEQEAERARE